MVQRSETFPCFGEYLVKIISISFHKKFHIRALNSQAKKQNLKQIIFKMGERF